MYCVRKNQKTTEKHRGALKLKNTPVCLQLLHTPLPFFYWVKPAAQKRRFSPAERSGDMDRETDTIKFVSRIYHYPKYSQVSLSQMAKYL